MCVCGTRTNQRQRRDRHRTVICNTEKENVTVKNTRTTVDASSQWHSHTPKSLSLSPGARRPSANTLARTRESSAIALASNRTRLLLHTQPPPQIVSTVMMVNPQCKTRTKRSTVTQKTRHACGGAAKSHHRKDTHRVVRGHVCQCQRSLVPRHRTPQAAGLCRHVYAIRMTP